MVIDLRVIPHRLSGSCLDTNKKANHNKSNQIKTTTKTKLKKKQRRGFCHGHSCRFCEWLQSSFCFIFDFVRRLSVLPPGAEGVHFGRRLSVLQPGADGVHFGRRLSVMQPGADGVHVGSLVVCGATGAEGVHVGRSFSFLFSAGLFGSLDWQSFTIVFVGCGWWSSGRMPFPIIHRVSFPTRPLPMGVRRVRVGELVFWRWSETRGIKDQAPIL